MFSASTATSNRVRALLGQAALRNTPNQIDGGVGNSALSTGLSLNFRICGTASAAIPKPDCVAVSTA